MELDITKVLLAPGMEIPFEANVELPPQDVTGDTVTFDTISLKGTACAMDDTVRLAGTLHTTAHAPCAMCLAPANAELELDFDEVFRKDADEFVDEAFHYEGSKVPLDQLALTLVMLNLPMRFLCREDCDGGEQAQKWRADVSKSSCEDGSPSQRPFEALQHLLTKDEEV